MNRKFIKKVQGYEVNLGSLKILNRTVRLDYEEHVNANQCPIQTFAWFSTASIINVMLHSILMSKGANSAPFFATAIFTLVVCIVWGTCSYIKRLRSCIKYLFSFWYICLVLVNILAVYFSRNKMFGIKQPLQDSENSLILHYFIYLSAYSYCQFRSILYFATPMLIVGSIVCCQLNMAEVEELSKLLPEHYSYLLDESMSKTISKVTICALCGIVAKYNEELSTIYLIIAKWSRQNLNSSLTDFFRTQRDGLIIYETNATNSE